MASNRMVTIAGLLVMLAVMPASLASSMFTLTFGDGGAASAEAAAFGSSFESGKNADFDMSEFKNATAITVSRVRLAPCVVRVMHLHRDVDELYLSTGGKVAVATAFPNGTIVRDVLAEGQSFVIVRNWVHTIYNPDCKQDASFLSFINGKEGFNSNVAKAAFDINAGPFKAYTDAKFLDSTQKAIGLFAVDPVCLKRCGLGPIGGIKPAPSADYTSGYPEPSPCTGRKARPGY